MPGPHPRLMRFAVAVVGALACFAIPACMRPSPPLSPAEAPAVAAETITAILERSPAAPPRFAAPPDSGSTTVRVWYPDHPLMRRLAMPETHASFAESHPAFELEAQNIGEWMYAVQKLAVHFAGGGLPDIAIVRRDLLAQLVPSGKLVALDTILPPAFIQDLERPVANAFSVDGTLVALPADAYHSVLYLDADAPLQPLGRFHAPVPPTELMVGHVPFLELLWAQGGDVLADDSVPLNDAAAVESFRLMHTLYAEELGVSDRFAAFDETHGLALFTAGRARQTVASSRMYRRVLEEKPDTQVHALPAASGGVSRWGEYGIVVLDGAAASPAAILAALEFLTGPVMQGAGALASGSPPVRQSVRESLGPAHPLTSTFRNGRATPLVPEWGEIEAALLGIVERVTRH